MRTLYFYPVVSSSSSNSFFFFSSPNLSGRIQSGCRPYFYTWCGVSANLRRRSETCCTQPAENTDRKSRQKSPSGHHRTNLSGYIFATKARIDNRKKLLSSNISSTCLHNMVNFGPLAVEIGLPVWGTQANFNGFRVLAAVTARQSSSGRQSNFAAFNRGCHLCSAGRPSRWTSAHILVTN